MNNNFGVQKASIFLAGHWVFLHSSINATLTLTQHKYRVNADVLIAENYIAGKPSLSHSGFWAEAPFFVHRQVQSSWFESLRLAFSDARYISFKRADSISPPL